MALLHPAREPRAAGGAAARAALAHLLAQRHAGDGARPRRGGAGARAGAPLARLPVLQPRQPAGALGPHVVCTLSLSLSLPLRCLAMFFKIRSFYA